MSGHIQVFIDRVVCVKFVWSVDAVAYLLSISQEEVFKGQSGTLAAPKGHVKVPALCEGLEFKNKAKH